MGNQGPHQMDIARWGLGVDRLADSAIAFGGRLGYEDAGDVANTEVGIFEFGDKTLVFEVRGLETDPLRGAKVGVIFYGSEGYVVLTSYDGAARPSIPSGKLVTKFNGGGDHFGNFVDAVKARNPKLLHGRHPRRPPLLRPQPPGQRLLLPGQAGLGRRDPQDARGAEDQRGRRPSAWSGPLKHLAANGVDLAKTPMSLGPMLKIDPQNETILGQPGGQRHADPRVPRPVHRAQGGRGLSSATQLTRRVRALPACPAPSATAGRPFACHCWLVQQCPKLQ